MGTLDLRKAARLFYGGSEASALYLGAGLLWERPTSGPVEETLFGATAPGAFADDGEGAKYTLAVGFTASVSGSITRVRFYQPPDDPTTLRAVAVWEYAMLAASAEGAVSGAPGWTEIALPEPVAVTPGSIYMAGVFIPNGRYGYTSAAFTGAVPAGHLTALATGDMTLGYPFGNGRFSTAPTLSYPDQSFNANWYGVDVVFVPDD